MSTYNLNVVAPAIKNALDHISASGGKVINIDADGTIHTQVTAADDWSAAVAARAIQDTLGAGATAVRRP